MAKLEENLYLNSTEQETSKLKVLSQKVGSNIENVLDEEEKIASLNFVIKKIKELNPSVEIKTGTVCDIIFSSVPEEDLILPEGFYCSQINGITNKYATDSKNYTSVRVYPIEYYDPTLI